MKTSSKNYWLIKSEPHTWSWEQQKHKKTTHWDGVRNYQASNNMKLMKKGDECFFYHSGEERAIKGIVTVIKEYYPDHTDETGRFGMVDVKYVKDLENIEVDDAFLKEINQLIKTAESKSFDICQGCANIKDEENKNQSYCQTCKYKTQLL